MTSKKLLLVKTLETQQIQEKLKQCLKLVDHIFCSIFKALIMPVLIFTWKLVVNTLILTFYVWFVVVPASYA